MNIELTNGTTDSVVRIGQTVHRTRSAASDAVEALLAHLESRGFKYAPRFMGIDGKGRQVLSYISGKAGNYPTNAEVWNDSALKTAAKILREFHDHSESFDWTKFSTWQSPCPTGVPAEVICHNDFATYNCIYQNNQPVGMIDFDSCGPGSRAWDLAYMAFRFVPIATPKQQKAFGLATPVQIEHRLETLLEAYGFTDIASILDLIAPRIIEIRDTAERLAQGNDRNAQRIRDEKHVDSYNEALHHFQDLFGRK